MSEKNEQGKKTQRPIRCVVKSASMNKSRVGISEWRKKDPICGKFIRCRTRIMFHDEQNESKAGDTVLVAATRPMSGKKSYKLVQIVKKARV